MRSALRVCLILFAALLLVPATASGQMLGVSGGLTIASAAGDDVPDDLESRTSFNAGAFAVIPLNDRFSVVPGAYYVEKGAEDPDDGLQTKLNYVEIPLLLSASLYRSDRYGFSLFAGPSLAFEVQCFQEVSFRSEGMTDTGDVECEDLEPAFETKSLDVGAMVGASVMLELGGTTALVLQGGLDIGLTSIDDGPAEQDLKNSAFFVNAGLAWSPGG